MADLDPPDMEETRKFAAEIAAVGTALFHRSLGDQRPLSHQVASLFVWRGVRCLEAVVGLSMLNRTVEAFALLRTLCELDIDFAYILKDSTHERMTRFWNYRFIRDKDRYTAIRKAMAEVGKATSDHIVAAGPGISQRERKVKGDYKSGTSGGWSGISVEQRAKETGRWFQEEIIMSIGNMAVHPSSESFFYDFQIQEFAHQQQTVLVQRSPDPFGMYWGAQFLVRITAGAAKVLGIDTADCLADARSLAGGAEPQK